MKLSKGKNLNIILEYLLDSEGKHYEENYDLGGRRIIRSLDTDLEEVKDLIKYIEEDERFQEHIYYNILLLLKDYLETE